MVMPSVPQRPARSQNIDIPTIPARPKRSVDRSISPNRDSFARSPLNDPAYFPPGGKPAVGPSTLSKSISRELPPRPPSVTLPSIGQEGSEYAAINESDSSLPETTKTVPGELPLHAPKASLPVSTAKSRISAVTRTDSASAAAHGIGKASGDQPVTPGHAPSQLAHEISRSSSSQQRSRPASVYNTEDPDEHGIPEIGVQVPLLGNAGDVQAPTPAQGTPVSAAAAAPPVALATPEARHHTRTKSGREIFRGPPGSYGLHGHGITHHTDPFEKAWYDKHPEAHAREAAGEYGPKIPMERKEYNLSSAELNKIVHTNDSQEDIQVSTPDEQIGYLASEEYAQRISSPRSASRQKRRSVQYAESPLHTVSVPADKEAGEGEAQAEEEVIHVDPPTSSFVEDNGNGHAATETPDPESFNQPILADDEVAKRPEGQFMTPAVDLDEDRLASWLPDEQSRPHSRSNSIQHAVPPVLSRFTTNQSDREGTPLEDVKEYEPLFPEDEKELKKTPSIAEGEGPRHQFPSKDVWEDSPDSVHYQTTVQTPQIPEFSRPEAEHEPKEIFETPEAEEARKAAQKSAVDSNDMPELTKVKSGLNRDVLAEKNSSSGSRPGMRHRFPSQDVWEDTPSSLMYTTEITPDNESTKPVPEIPSRPKPSVPSRPGSKPAAAAAGGDEELTFAKSKPPVPARPGNKISALRGAFMSDLESRLKVGPQAVPTKAEEEEEAAREAEEKPPLADARKGRARGPARRKPGVSPGGGAGATAEHSRAAAKVSFVSAVTIWEIDEDGTVSVPAKMKAAAEAPVKDVEGEVESKVVEASA